MSITDLATILISAILTAGLYATMSFGLALIYGVMKIINLAHAGTMMLGAYATYWLYVSFQLNPFLAPLVVVPVFFFFGMGIERVLVRRIAGAAPIASLLLLFGVWLIMQNFAYLIFSGEPRSIPPQFSSLPPINFSGIIISTNRLIIFCIGVISLVALQIFLTRTNLGRAIRAIAVDAEAALLVGINTSRVSSIAFGLGVALASLAGSLMSLIFTFDPDFGRSHLLKSFCIVVLGGLESFVGVAIGALVLAFAEAFSLLWLKAALQDFVSFGLLVVVLIVMPNGLMGLLRRKT